MENKDFIEFAKEQFPKLEAKWKIYNAQVEDLLNQPVFGIRSGFSCGDEGRFMILTKIDPDGKIWLTDPYSEERQWLSDMKNKHNDFIFLADKLKLMDKMDRSNFEYVHSNFLNKENIV